VSFGAAGSDGVTQGINLGPLGGTSGTTLGPNMVYGLAQDNTQGSPAPPSLYMPWVGYFGIRWGVQLGTQSLIVAVMQPANLAPYPSLVVKANKLVGVMSDVTFTSTGSTTWIDITASITATAPGALWVELHNNLHGSYDPTSLSQVAASPCWWDNIRVA